MTVYCLPPCPAVVLPADSGFSEAANRLRQLVGDEIQYYLGPRAEWAISGIEQILSESGNPETSPIEVTPVDVATARAAVAFSLLLPRSLPAPEIAPEPDGEISFDWLGPSEKIFSVSVDATGRLAYAGSFGPRSKVHGTEQLSSTCPPEIIRGISKTYR
jgi:hypothetical protein